MVWLVYHTNSLPLIPHGHSTLHGRVPKTSTYLNEQAGSQYFIQIKAKPDGLFYKGYWSDWSNTLTVDLPSNNGKKSTKDSKEN